MHTATVVNIRPRVDWIVLRVLSEVIILVVGRRHYAITVAGGRGSPRLIIINNWTELIIRRLIVSLLWIGRGSGWSVFTSVINTGG